MKTFKAKIKILIFIFIPALILASSLELYARILFSSRTGNNNWLWHPLFANVKFQEVKVYSLDKIDYFLGTDHHYYKFAPGRHWFSLTNLYYTINSLGFRSPEFQPQKPAGTFRIFAIGASSVMGLESQYEETFPEQLRTCWQARSNRQLEMINAGISSANSTHLRNLLNEELLKYSPDVLIFYLGRNDLSGYGENNSARVTVWLHNNLPQIHKLLYYNWSIFYTLAVEKYASIKGLVSKADINNYLSARSRLINNLRAMVKTCQLNDVTPVIVKQQLKYSAQLPAELAHADSKEILDYLQKNFSKLRQNFFMTFKHEILYRDLDVLGEELKVAVIDPGPAFRNELKAGDSLFVDNLHLTPKGNKVLADVICKGYNPFAK